MKGKIVLILLCLAVASFGVAGADETDNATSHVFVDVDPNIAVLPSLVSVDLGSIQTGEFNGDIRFRIDANTEQVSLYAVVSYLYKGDDCANTDVSPILISVPDGVVADPENANPTGGHSPTMIYIGPGDQPPCFVGSTTETVTFESSQNGHFSQYLTLTPTWIQEDPEKPQGEYSGFVSLYAFVGGI